jgi:hypothetical protein
MKTTLEIQDALLLRAKRYAKRSAQPLRAVVEEGLRRVLSAQPSPIRYLLPDRSVGDPRRPDPLETLSWQDLRGIVYGEPET